MRPQLPGAPELAALPIEHGTPHGPAGRLDLDAGRRFDEALQRAQRASTPQHRARSEADAPRDPDAGRSRLRARTNDATHDTRGERPEDAARPEVRTHPGDAARDHAADQASGTDVVRSTAGDEQGGAARGTRTSTPGPDTTSAAQETQAATGAAASSGAGGTAGGASGAPIAATPSTSAPAAPTTPVPVGGAAVTAAGATSATGVGATTGVQSSAAGASAAGAVSGAAPQPGETPGAVLLDERWELVEDTPAETAPTTASVADSALTAGARLADAGVASSASVVGTTATVASAATGSTSATSATAAASAAALARSLGTQLEGGVRALLAPNGPNRIEIELHPARLGAITLQCRRELGHSEVTVVVHNPAALGALTDAARDLQQRLADTRLSFTVQTSLEARTGAGEGGAGQGAAESLEGFAQPALRIGARTAAPATKATRRSSTRADGLDLYL